MTNVTRNMIEALLMEESERGMHAVGRALLALNARQTADEQREETTKYHNMRGFTHSDAKRGTGMAGYYARNGRLTDKQVNYWRTGPSRPRIIKYAGQLLIVAQEKAAKKV